MEWWHIALMVAGGSSSLFTSSSSSSKKKPKVSPNEVKLDHKYPWNYSYRIVKRDDKFILQQAFKNLKYDDIYYSLLSLATGSRNKEFKSEEAALKALSKIIAYESKDDKSKDEVVKPKAAHKQEGRNISGR